MSQMDQEPIPDDDGAHEQIARAFARVYHPALTLIVVGACNLILGSLFIAQGFRINDMTPAELLDELKRTGNPEWIPAGARPEELKDAMLIWTFVGGPVWVVAAVVTVTAGMYMRTLRHYRLVMLGALLAAIPGLGPLACCGLGELAGIWAIVLLRQPDVRSFFV